MLEIDNLGSTAIMLGMFMLTVILGLAIQAFGTLPLIYFIFTRHNPYKFLAGLSQAVLTALGTSSSAATLPITFKCVNGMGIDSRVTKFVLPVGAMVNMVSGRQGGRQETEDSRTGQRCMKQSAASSSPR